VLGQGLDFVAVGYRGHDDWRDMSDYVVHFTKPDGDMTSYRAMTNILATGRIEARSVWVRDQRQRTGRQPTLRMLQ
jgi:hypothetical protein